MTVLHGRKVGGGSSWSWEIGSQGPQIRQEVGGQLELRCNLNQPSTKARIGTTGLPGPAGPAPCFSGPHLGAKPYSAHWA